MNNAPKFDLSSTQANFKFCASCGVELPTQAKFCPSCGIKVGLANAAKISSATLAKRITPLALLVFAVGYGVSLTTPESPTLNDKPKATTTTHSTSDKDAFSDPKIKDLKAAADKSPNDIAAQTDLAQALLVTLNETKKPSSNLIFSTIEVLRHIIDLDPKNKNALVAMGDISFNQGVFDKAVDYYQKYLAIEPNDDEVKVNYANSLIFIGKATDGAKELETTFKKNPKDFRTSVSLALAYIKAKDEVNSKRTKAIALTLAPNDDERKKLSEFFESVAKKDQPQSEPATTQEPATATTNNPAELVAEILKANPVAGPKFVKASEISKEEVEVVFSDFPMAQMPPFAKAKFYSGLKEKISAQKGHSLRKITFKDMATGNILDTLDLSAK